MKQTPTQLLETIYQLAKKTKNEQFSPDLSSKNIQNLQTVVDNAESLKAVLGVTLTSIVHKIHEPKQDVRKHQDRMEDGYSGRTFDTKYITPFLKKHFSHYAMAESAWLTRSLEQPHPYNFDYPGKIRSEALKSAFLNILDSIQVHTDLAPPMLSALMKMLLEAREEDESLFTEISVKGELTIVKIVDAVKQHINFNYAKGVVGTARLPVLAIYSVYNLLLSDIKRYKDRTLAPLESHTSPDSRSKVMGDIDINNADGTCFESVEIKHNKPISVDMIGVAYRKFKNIAIDRYYVLTTGEPNFEDYDNVILEIEKYERVHSCQIIVNGVIPSLKYYLRLTSNPQNFIDEYTKWLEIEFQRSSGVKREHLQVWQEIRQNLLNIEIS